VIAVQTETKSGAADPSTSGTSVERIGVAGSGRIACGLAAVAAEHGQVVLWARSDGSAKRAQAYLAKRGEACAANVEITLDLGALRDSTIVIEAIVEETASKAALYRRLHPLLPEDTLLATTTSALSVETLGAASGRPSRFAALHVFNPVTKMPLIELAFPAPATAETRERARALCVALGKTPVEVPDIPGFVVNRLLFPYLFDAVRLHERTGLSPEAIDACMTLGAGHPSGPLALLDYVGLDVTVAIAAELEIEVPHRITELVAVGALGRKSGRGFYEHS
jgi:3-hydroxybutyryl-CoA dehydrogenase